MAKLEILTAPHPILNQKALPVEQVDDEVRRLMDDMLETMYENNAVGLAANQVGILKRILVLDLQNDDDDKNRPKDFYPLFIANPEISESEDEFIEAKEACLSVPEQVVEVKRPAGIKITYLDYYNEKRELAADGWLARAILHEVDHLDGKLIINYLSNLKRDIVLKKLIKLKKISV